MNVNGEAESGAAQSPVAATWQRDPADDLLVIPDGCWDIVAHPATGSLRLIGVMTEPRDLPPDGPRDLFGLRLRPGLCRHVLGVSALELRDADLPLDDVAPQLARRIREAGCTRQALIEALSDRWRRQDPPQQTVARLDHAVGMLSRPAPENTPAQVSRAAEAIGVSPRQLERLFLEHVGTSPKFFQRVMRLHAALRALRGTRGRPGGIADAVAAGGYADQSHFTREAGVLARRTPGQLQALLHGGA